MKKLYKSTIVIYSEYDPSDKNIDIDTLTKEACNGNAYCTEYKTELVNPLDDKDFDGDEFFNIIEE